MDLPINGQAIDAAPAKGRSQTAREKILVLQAGRGLAAFAVVLFHANIVYAQHFADGVRPYPILSLGSVGVEYFFVLSGLIMTLVHRGDLGAPGRLGHYLRSRLVRIFPIYWIVLTLLLVGGFAMNRAEESLTGPASYVRAYLLMPFEGESPLTAAWTLSHELLFYAVFALAILNRRFGFAVIAIWTLACAVATAGYLTGLLALSFPLSFLFSVYNVFFAFGIVSALVFRSVSLPGAGGLLGLGTLAFLVAAVLQLRFDVPDLTALYGLAAALLITGLVRFESAGHIRVAASLVWLGDASYSLYLFHGPALVLLALILGKTGLAATLGAAGTMAIMILAATVGGLLFYALVERPMLNFLSHHLPGRRRSTVLAGATASKETAG